VGGEGDVGKSRVVEAVRLGLRLLQREEVLVLVPTGNAALELEEVRHTPVWTLP
jgi:hypothetical protein